MTIDAHVHFFPDGLVEAMRKRENAPCIKTIPNGDERRFLPAGNSLPFSRETDTDMNRRLALMDALGIDCQVLSMGLLFGVHALPLEEAAPLARLFNDELGALCRRHPLRFKGLALLPMADIASAAGEFRRTRTEHGLAGAIVPANSLVSLAEAEKLRPIFDVAQETGAHIFVHPGRRADEAAAQRKAGGPAHTDNAPARQALEVQTSLASAAVTLLFSAFLDPYPDVTVQVANLGGALPMVVERMDHATRLRAPDDPLPSGGARRVYVDCASLGPRAVEIAVALFGADHVLFGTDCPIFRTDWTLDAVASANIASADRNAVLHGNAERLFEGSAA